MGCQFNVQFGFVGLLSGIRFVVVGVRSWIRVGIVLGYMYVIQIDVWLLSYQRHRNLEARRFVMEVIHRQWEGIAT